MSRMVGRRRRRSARLDLWLLAAAIGTAMLVAAGVVVILEYGPRVYRGESPVALGAKAPMFVLEATTGGQVNFTDYAGHRPVLLVFYSGYSCTGCSFQLRKLERELDRIRTTGAAVLAITDEDALTARLRLRASEGGIHIPVLADRALWVTQQYGMKDPDTARTLTGYVIIDRAGKVRARKIEPLFGERLDEIAAALRAASSAAD